MATLLKDSFQLLNATTTVTANGSAVKLTNNLEGFGAVLVASSVGGTTPTADLELQFLASDKDSRS